MSTELASTPLRSPIPAVFPELCIEWLPTLGPGASDGPWADLTPYVAGGGTAAGRRYETDRFDTGQMKLTLETPMEGLATDRLFDPDWTDGPFYPWLVPMRQIRFTAITPSGSFEPVMRGYITDWGQTVEQDKKYVTTITVRDAFVRLEQIKLPSSAWALEIVKDDPSLWLRLGERDTVRLTDSSAGGNYGLYDNCQQGVQGLVVNDADSAAAFAHSLEERVKVQNPELISGYPFTVSLMFKIDSADPAGHKSLFSGLLHSSTFPSTPGGGGLEISMPPQAGLVLGLVSDGTNRRATWFGASSWDDNRPHHLAFVCSSSTSQAAYMDGVDVTLLSSFADTTAWPGNPPNGYTVGNYPDLLAGDYGFGVNDVAAITAANPFPLKERGTIDEVCVWDGVEVSAERVAAHSLAALTGWEGDDTGTRADRFLDKIDWPATLRDIDEGISILGPASWSAGSSALAAMQAWADTELGAFFAGKSGEIMWRSRHYPLLNTRATTSQATFGDAASGLALGYADIELVRDEAILRNPVSASRTGGVTVSVKDDELIEKYGDRSYAMSTTQDQLDSAVRDRALWGLARWKELNTRVASVTITPTSDPLLWDQVLGLELGDRITIERTPLGVGPQIVTDQIIERIEHTFTRNTWVTKFATSPVDPHVGDYLILDDPVFGLLDQQLLAY